MKITMIEMQELKPFAEMAEALQVGTEIKTVWKPALKENQEIRKITDKQGLVIEIDGSELDLRDSFFEFDGRFVQAYHPGQRKLTAQEKEMLENGELKTEQWETVEGESILSSKIKGECFAIYEILNATA